METLLPITYVIHSDLFLSISYQHYYLNYYIYKEVQFFSFFSALHIFLKKYT